MLPLCSKMQIVNWALQKVIPLVIFLFLCFQVFSLLLTNWFYKFFILRQCLKGEKWRYLQTAEWWDAASRILWKTIRQKRWCTTEFCTKDFQQRERAFHWSDIAGSYAHLTWSLDWESCTPDVRILVACIFQHSLNVAALDYQARLKLVAVPLINF